MSDDESEKKMGPPPLNPKEIIINTKLQKAARNAMSKKVLHLGYCSLGAETLGVVIRHMRLHNVQEVDLRCNAIGPDALVILSHSLHHDRLGLRKLGLKLNTAGQDRNLRGTEALADALTENTKLQYLDLRYGVLEVAPTSLLPPNHVLHFLVRAEPLTRSATASSFQHAGITVFTTTTCRL